MKMVFGVGPQGEGPSFYFSTWEGALNCMNSFMKNYDSVRCNNNYHHYVITFIPVYEDYAEESFSDESSSDESSSEEGSLDESSSEEEDEKYFLIKELKRVLLKEYSK